jgi:hypothetical protein
MQPIEQIEPWPGFAETLANKRTSGQTGGT